MKEIPVQELLNIKFPVAKKIESTSPRIRPPYINNPIKFHDSKRGMIKRFVGVEMEVCGISGQTAYDKLMRWAEHWQASVVTDGSIRSNYGMEIRTAPAKGLKFTNQIKQVCKILREGEVTVNKSCGLHVHVDCRDFGGGIDAESRLPKDMAKLVYVWSKIEPEMFTFVSESRKQVDWCKSWADTYTRYGGGFATTEQAQKFIKESKPVAIFDKIKGTLRGDRFHSLNLQAYQAHKTVENRMHHGTANAKKIFRWAAINSKIVDFAFKTPMNMLEEMKELTLNQILTTDLTT